jgi:hypothetical protein
VEATANPRPELSALTVATLVFAIACFTLAATPANQIRWRRGAVFVLYRRVNVTVAGLLSLLGAGVLLLLTRNR